MQDDREAIATVTARLMRRLDKLATCSDSAGGLTRLYLSPAHRQAVDLVSGWMRQAGLSVRLDAAATLVGVLPGPAEDAPTMLVGSHIDTVRDAGRYDGALGVLGGLAALELLRLRGTVLPFDVALLAFGDEEGVRFPATLTGSRALAGTLDAEARLLVRDADGITLGDALAQFGCVPDRLAAARFAGRALGFVELHIEQGPVLERAGRALGIVTAINGASRYEIVVTGEAGHAGTVPMRGRRDALAAAAEMLVAIRQIGLASPDVTATVGRIVAEPGAVNVIPGRVVFTLDLRTPDDGQRAMVRRDILGQLDTIAAAHGVEVAATLTHDAAAALCDAGLQAGLEEACATVGVETMRLPSGAGHDAMALAELCPMAMLFVRCRGGISHNPAEFIEPDDAATAVQALVAFLSAFGGARGG